MYRIFNSYFLLQVCVYIGVGVCQTLDAPKIESATAGLIDRFDRLKEYGLGVRRIEVNTNKLIN